MEKTYIGTRNPDGSTRVIVAISADGRCHERELRHVVKHSPSGFEWGNSDGHRLPVMNFDVTVSAHELESFGVRFDFLDRGAALSGRVPFALLGRVKVVEVEGGLAPVVSAQVAASAKLPSKTGSFLPLIISPDPFFAWATPRFPPLVAFVAEGRSAHIACADSFEVHVGAPMWGGVGNNLPAGFASFFRQVARSAESRFVSFAEWRVAESACHMDLVPHEWVSPNCRSKAKYGPSDLAHSILAESLERPEVSPAMYHQFKFDLVSGMSRDGFKLDHRDVMQWVNRRWSEMPHDMICGDLNVA